MNRVPEHAPLDGALIAAVARVNDMTIGTRNTKHVEPLGAQLVDPWTTKAS
ncbi:hypothetical protein [Nocardioides sp. AN3]